MSIVGSIRKHTMMLGNIGLVLVMLLGLAYLSFSTLQWRPWQDQYKLTVNFPVSGGLQETSPVTLRGVHVGQVDKIQVKPTGLQVQLKVDDNVKINRNTTVSALGLSAVGEQYVDFTPPSSEGPYLRDGDTVQVNQTKVTAPFPKLLETSLNVIDQIEPQKLAATVQNLNVALGSRDGTNQLRTLFDAGGTIFADLYRVLGPTTRLIQNAGTILRTSSQIQPDLGRLTNGASTLINAAVDSDAELRTLLGRGPSEMTSLTGSLNQIRDPLSDVLREFADIAHQGSLRAPALANLFPSIRDGSGQAKTMFHDGAWWVLASLYPRPTCNYSVTPVRPTKILELAVPSNLYCVTQDPNQQIRGSANAPRPPGDDTAGPAPGSDPNARTQPMGN